MATAPKLKNPPWERDELILALDLYFRVDPARVRPTDDPVVAVSNLLNKLPLAQRNDATNYRSANAVCLKLQNFRVLDTGKGMPHGGDQDRKIWDEFANNKAALATKAAEIAARLSKQ